MRWRLRCYVSPIVLELFRLLLNYTGLEIYITHMRMFIAISGEVGVSMWGVYTNTAVLQSRLIDPHKDLEA